MTFLKRTLPDSENKHLVVLEEPQSGSISTAVLMSGVNLLRCQPATPMSRYDAVDAANSACPGIDWDGLFRGLEAAGLVAFMGERP